MRGIGTRVLLFLLLLCSLAGCQSADEERLTVEDIRSMAAEKGEALTWSDFERYPSVETGFGLYIRVYETDGDYRLMIGGAPDDAPMYLYLVSTRDDDRRIDIRYDNIDDFLDETD